MDAITDATVPDTSLHASVGGDRPFYDLVDAFYAGVEGDAVLRPLYPRELAGAKVRLAQFLIQRFGGDTKYSESRGHPRLRMRHMRFKIGNEEKEAWMRHMKAALEQTPAFDVHRSELLGYFENTAAFLVNDGGRMCCG